MKRLLLISSLLLCFVSIGNAQQYSSSGSFPARTYISPTKHRNAKASSALFTQVNQGFEYIYNFEFVKADSLIGVMRKKYAMQPMTYLLSANYFWWMIISGEDNEINRLRFRQDLDLANTILKSQPSDSLSNEELFILINTYSFKSRLELKQKNYLKGMFYVNDCIRYLKTSFGKENEYEPFLFTSGIYNYFCDYGMQNYPILYPSLLFLPEGNMKLGLQQLEKVSKSKEMLLSNEGTYFLLKIYLDMEKEPSKAVDYAEVLVNRHPNNIVYQYLLFKALISGDNFPQASKQLEAVNRAALTNQKLTLSQKEHFLKMAKDDLRSYFARNQD